MRPYILHECDFVPLQNVTLYRPMNVTYCRWMCDLIPLYECDLITP